MKDIYKQHFLRTLSKVGYQSSRFPNALLELEKAYNNLLKILEAKQLEIPDVLKMYCIKEYNQITNEIKKIEERNDFLWKQDLKQMTSDELDDHQIELDYYHDVLTWADDARGALIGHLVAYYPDIIKKNNLTNEAIRLLGVNNPLIKILGKPEMTKKEIVESELKIDQIALKYAYEGIQITRVNGNEIAKQYGHNSGEKLYHRFTYFSSSANRKGKPTLCTPTKLKNRIELIESIIDLLPIDKQDRAKDEVLILKKIFEAEYQ